MEIDNYKAFFNDYFGVGGVDVSRRIRETVELLEDARELFFIGNGGSNSICSHMMQDFGKMARYRTHAFSDPSLITCYANDYGYTDAMKEWIRLYMDEGDLLFAISSSGNSENIVRAADQAREMGGKLVTLSGFKEDNKLRQRGDVSFFLPVENYGIVECFHQVILHAVLDEVVG